ncbi:MAG TPA: hypothetical protein VG796_03400 [Verrucomicrobiales bacterium]|nr:hypothetical protein [Verrucomicrobiales bacterium]
MESAASLTEPLHLPHLPPCPLLPVPATPLTARCIASLAADRGTGFYHTALLYSQSLWLQGYPARAILLLNRAMGCDLDGTEPILAAWPLPYKAAAWMLRNHLPEHFIGNPRRHWQHLATRMVEPRKELRTWRAWACWRMACLILPHLPADELQLSRENIREPSEGEIAGRLECLGIPGELEVWRDALRFSSSPPNDE